MQRPFYKRHYYSCQQQNSAFWERKESLTLSGSSCSISRGCESLSPQGARAKAAAKKYTPPLLSHCPKRGVHAFSLNDIAVHRAQAESKCCPAKDGNKQGSKEIPETEKPLTLCSSQGLFLSVRDAFARSIARTAEEWYAACGATTVYTVCTFKEQTS